MYHLGLIDFNIIEAATPVFLTACLKHAPNYGGIAGILHNLHKTKAFEGNIPANDMLTRIF